MFTCLIWLATVVATPEMSYVPKLKLVRLLSRTVLEVGQPGKASNDGETGDVRTKVSCALTELYVYCAVARTGVPDACWIHVLTVICDELADVTALEPLMSCVKS